MPYEENPQPDATPTATPAASTAAAAPSPGPVRRRTSLRTMAPTLVLLVTVVGLMLFGPDTIERIARAQTFATVTRVQHELASDEALATLSDSFKKVAKVVSPSVVRIDILQRSGRRGMGEPVARGEGSGWVYDKAGHIITNNHVVEGADLLRVRFSDGSQYDATVVATDPPTDVAVIKIEAEVLIPAKVAPEPVEQGEIVFAFGSPLAFDFSMSQGIVSAQGRDLNILDRVERDRFGRPYLSQQGYESFIQTDAAINRGNSGGPLTNIYGEVVGMNSAIVSPGSGSPFGGGGGGFVGLGFAIPVQMVQRVADQIIENGEVQRGFLGISIRDLTPDLAESFGFEGQGVLVQGLVPDGPADKAGIQPGDIITAIDGQKTENPSQLRLKVSSLQPGTPVDVEFMRGGEEKSVRVELTRVPGEATASVERDKPGSALRGRGLLDAWGIQDVSTFDRRLARMLDLPFREGVLIEGIESGSPADRRGLAESMIIHRVGNQRIGERDVTSVEALTDALGAFEPGEIVRFSVWMYDMSTSSFMNMFVILRVPGE